MKNKGKLSPFGAHIDKTYAIHFIIERINAERAHVAKLYLLRHFKY